jgi:hypothetical protein
MRRIKVPFLFLLLLGALVACGGGSTPPARQQTALSAPADGPTPSRVSSAPAGDYATTITTRDGTVVSGVSAIVAPDSTGSLSLGFWLISFRNDGYFTAQGPNSNTSEQYEGLGQYRVAGDLLTVSDVKCWEFNGPQAYTATYRWQLQGKTLLLSVVGREICTIRKILLTSHPLILQQGTTAE